MVLNRETRDALAKLIPVFQGEYGFDPEAPRTDDYVLAIAFGWYLSRIAPAQMFADPKPFIGEIDWRLKNAEGEGGIRQDGKDGIRRNAWADLFYLRPPTSHLSIHGLSDGCLDRLRLRASRVLTAILELSDITGRGELQDRIRQYDDQLVVDCAIWGVTHWANQSERRAPTAVVQYIQSKERRNWQ